MLRLLIYQITSSYNNFINKALILSIFLYFRYSHIYTKLLLVNNIVIDHGIILLTYINITYTYSTLILNKRQLLFLIINILAIYITTSSYLTNFLACFLLI